jgi:hypothetical protein
MEFVCNIFIVLNDRFNLLRLYCREKKGMMQLDVQFLFGQNGIDAFQASDPFLHWLPCKETKPILFVGEMEFCRSGIDAFQASDPFLHWLPCRETKPILFVGEMEFCRAGIDAFQAPDPFLHWLPCRENNRNDSK